MKKKILQRSAHGQQKHKKIQAQILFTLVLSNIVRDYDIKANEEQEKISEEDLKNNIILDSESSNDLFSNIQLVMDTKRSHQVIHLYTNMGSKINQIQAMVPDYVKLWNDDKAIADIFSLTNLVNKYRFSYESHQDDGFDVHANRGIIQFRRNKQGMYVFKPT